MQKKSRHIRKKASLSHKYTAFKVRRSRVNPDCPRFAPHGCRLQRKEALWVITFLGAHLSNPVLVVIAQVIEPQAVHTFIYSLYQFVPELGQSGRIYITLKDGILNTLSIRYTDSGYFSEPLLSSTGCCIHIVCNDHQHKAPPTSIGKVDSRQYLPECTGQQAELALPVQGPMASSRVNMDE